MTNVQNTTTQGIASTILNQLGGNRFIAMTGAKNLGFGNDEKNNPYLSFKVGRNSKNVSHVRITLNAMDTYDMQFMNIRAGKVKIVSEFDGAYDDMLQNLFTKNTGLYTKF